MRGQKKVSSVQHYQAMALLPQERSSTEPGFRVGGQQAPMVLLSLPKSQCWGHKRFFKKCMAIPNSFIGAWVQIQDLIFYS